MAGRQNARSPFDPSRFIFEERSNPSSGGSNAVRFQSREASFTEQTTPDTRPQRLRATPRTAIRPKPSKRLLIIGFFFTLVAILTCLPTDPLTTSTLASRVTDAKRRILAAFWELKPVVAPTSVCAHTPAALRDILQEAALLARWGPVLRPDYALGADGGRIVSGLTSSKPEQPRSRSPISPIGPEVVIDEELTIGRCWTTAGTGQLGLSTPTVIYPQYVTVDHIPRQIALDISRAPRRMVLWGVVDGLSNVRRLQSLSTLDASFHMPFELTPRGRSAPLIPANHVFVALAAFEYDIDALSPTQTFAVFDHVRDSHMDFGIFVLEVVDNWGGAETCLYRVRIHGEPAVIPSQRGH